jgi:hypothetical protein
LVARWAHNPKVTGSSPVPATEVKGGLIGRFFHLRGYKISRCMLFHVYVHTRRSITKSMLVIPLIFKLESSRIMSWPLKVGQLSLDHGP